MIKREAANAVKQINKTFRALLVTGPRQVGKTTLLRSEMPENMNYVTLDDEKKSQNCARRPGAVFERKSISSFD